MDVTLVARKGCIALCGSTVDAVAHAALASTEGVPHAFVSARRARDGDAHHITVVSPPELKVLLRSSRYKRDNKRRSLDAILADMQKALGVTEPAKEEEEEGEGEAGADFASTSASKGDTSNALTAWVPLGVGAATFHDDVALFVVVLWPACVGARAALGLQQAQRDFHITLGFRTHDLHGADVHKGPASLAMLSHAGRRWGFRRRAGTALHTPEAAVLLAAARDVAVQAEATGQHVSLCWPRARGATSGSGREDEGEGEGASSWACVLLTAVFEWGRLLQRRQRRHPRQAYRTGQVEHATMSARAQAVVAIATCALDSIHRAPAPEPEARELEARLLLLRAIAGARLGQHDESVRDAGAVARLAPDSMRAVRAMLIAGGAHTAAGRGADARDCYLQGLELSTSARCAGAREVARLSALTQRLRRALGAAGAAASPRHNDTGVKATALFTKFPRTAHIFDAGGAAVTRDDLLLDPFERARFIHPAGNVLLTLEEKVDGANLGFWLDDDWTLRAQNRGHFVCEGAASQWRGLNSWIESHRSELLALLQPPRSRLLYGEWCLAKHTVHYTALPDHFIAFDVYETAPACFHSAQSRDALLAALAPTICIAPTLAVRAIHSRAELVELLDSRSRFRDGPVEGVYLRLDDDTGRTAPAPVCVGEGKCIGTAVARCKLVRPDFVQAINTGSHWTSRQLERNVVRPDLFAAEGGYCHVSAAHAQARRLHACKESRCTSGEGGDLLRGTTVVANAPSEAMPEASATTASVERVALVRQLSDQARELLAYGTSVCECKQNADDAPAGACSTPATLRPPTKNKYPSTPHLSFSPGVQDDDTLLTEAGCARFVSGVDQLVVTEKLDGGNCCLWRGSVYARTHAHEAKHWSFGPVKQLYAQLHDAHSGQGGVLADDNLQLFGENMFAQHSLDYGAVAAPFYLFGARNLAQDYWLSWAEIEALAARLGLPTVPVIFCGRCDSLPALQACMESEAALPSRAAADRSCMPEGFVVRVARGYFGHEENCVAKFVRSDHVQTGKRADWSRTARKATIDPEAVAAATPRPRLVLDYLTRRGNTPSAALARAPLAVFDTVSSGASAAAHPRRWFCDLDGVLADFDQGVIDLTGRSPTQLATSQMWRACARQTKGGGFFASLGWMRGARELWRAIVGQRPAILTGLPIGGGWARKQKISWCVKHVGPGVEVICCQSSQKFRWCRPGDVLIDDRERARRPWEQAGGVFILHHPDLLQQTLSQVKALVDADGDILAGGGTGSAHTALDGTGPMPAPEPVESTAKQRPKPPRKREAKAKKAAAKTARAAAKRAPCLILLVGLPGSGKSTFAERLARSSGQWKRVCQDEEGSRLVCEKLLGNCAKTWRQRVILDRCNVTAKERREWLKIAFSPPNAVAVFFDIPAKTCAARAAARKHHPTIPHGGGARAVQSFARALEPPTMAEGFAQVWTVRSEEDAELRLAQLGAAGDSDSV